MKKRPDITSKAQQVTYRKIANGIRDQILAGEFAPGTQLPSQWMLADTWQASSSTVHAAVQALVKEGWVESIRGGGVYVTEPKNRFVCAGIYHGADICSEEQTPFLRRVHVSLLKQLRHLKKETLIFMDTRPQKAQGTLFPALAEAIWTRRIQCLIFPDVHGVNLPALKQLRLPTATMGGSPSPHWIGFDLESMFREGVRSLVRKGCRSIGLLCSIHASETKLDPLDYFYDLFRKAVHDEGLTTRDSWIRRPNHFIRPTDFESYGYTEFKSLWKLPEKPDGLMIYPDTVARGAIMAVLDAGRSLITGQMKFVFHRNAHQSFLCPFPVTWAISDEDILAAGLIRSIQKQFDGEKDSPVLLPYQFKASEHEP